MCSETHILTNAEVNRFDPTRTTVLRNSFAKDMKRRFTELSRTILKTVIENDAFGLDINVFQMTPARKKQFAFPRSQDKIRAFMLWLEEQVRLGILEVDQFQQLGQGIERAWTNKYITDSYKRGIQRARYEVKKAGFEVPSIEQTGGVDMALTVPVHIDRLGLMYTRTFSDLKGITQTMDTQISRVLSQRLADGEGPRVLARKMIAVVNGAKSGELGLDVSYINKSGNQVNYFLPAERRAEILARTEVIRAHHQATIQEYKNWGVEGVNVQGEWKTAGDGRVCEECEALEGQIFTLEEINNKIPLHPQCRCIALPYIYEPVIK